MFDSYRWHSGSQGLCKKEEEEPTVQKHQTDFTHSNSLVLSLCRMLCASVCRTRPSSTNRQLARRRRRTSSRQQLSRRPHSRALPKLMAPPEPQGPPRAGVYSTVRIRGRPTRNLALGPLGPPQARGYYSQSTRLVRFLHQRIEARCIIQTFSEVQSRYPSPVVPFIDQTGLSLTPPPRRVYEASENTFRIWVNVVTMNLTAETVDRIDSV